MPPIRVALAAEVGAARLTKVAAEGASALRMRAEVAFLEFDMWLQHGSLGAADVLRQIREVITTSVAEASRALAVLDQCDAAAMRSGVACLAALAAARDALQAGGHGAGVTLPQPRTTVPTKGPSSL